MTSLLLATVGLVTGGPLLALVLAGLPHLGRIRRRTHDLASPRAFLLVLLVELRSGNSVLGSVHRTAARFPFDSDLMRASRVATVSGFLAAAEQGPPHIRQLFVQLERASRSGAPISATVETLLQADIAAERARRLTRARTLAVRLMIPLSLLILPGLMLMFYAPGLIGVVENLGGQFT